jgi:hypothetical protein
MAIGMATISGGTGVEWGRQSSTRMFNPPPYIPGTSPGIDMIQRSLWEAELQGLTEQLKRLPARDPERKVIYQRIQALTAKLEHLDQVQQSVPEPLHDLPERPGGCRCTSKKCRCGAFERTERVVNLLSGTLPATRS